MQLPVKLKNLLHQPHEVQKGLSATTWEKNVQECLVSGIPQTLVFPSFLVWLIQKISDTAQQNRKQT